MRVNPACNPTIQLRASEAPRAAQLEGRNLAVGCKAINRSSPSLQIGGDFVDGKDFIGRFVHVNVGWGG